jgi:hypothetical protein
MTIFNLAELKNYNLCLITTSKNKIETDVMLALLYMKGVNFYHIEIQTEKGFEKLKREFNDIFDVELSCELTAMPIIFEPKQKDWQVGLIWGNRDIIFQFIDERFNPNSAFPSKLSIWTSDNETHEVASKHTILMHIRILNRLFGQNFEKYTRELITDEVIKDNYEQKIMESLSKRAPAHINDSKYSLADELNALDLYYVTYIHHMLKMNESFIHKSEFAEWINYYKYTTSNAEFFKESTNHNPNKSF